MIVVVVAASGYHSDDGSAGKSAGKSPERVSEPKVLQADANTLRLKLVMKDVTS